jgi:hypothetical protein
MPVVELGMVRLEVEADGEGCAWLLITWDDNPEAEAEVGGAGPVTKLAALPLPLSLVRWSLEGAEAAVVVRGVDAGALDVQAVEFDAVPLDLGVEARRTGDSLPAMGTLLC